MYCIKCGVELADSEKVCPLCGTRVFHPDLPCGSGEPPYPPAEHLNEEVSRVGRNVRGHGMYAAARGHQRAGGLARQRRHRLVRLRGGRLAAAVCADGAALWFKRPNPVIFVPVDFTAIGVYLLYIDLATGAVGFSASPCR